MIRSSELTEAYEAGYLTDAEYAHAMAERGAKKRRQEERKAADQAARERDPINWF